MAANIKIGAHSIMRQNLREMKNDRIKTEDRFVLPTKNDSRIQTIRRDAVLGIEEQIGGWFN